MASKAGGGAIWRVPMGKGTTSGGGEAENANRAWDKARVARAAPEHRFEQRCPRRLPIDAL